MNSLPAPVVFTSLRSRCFWSVTSASGSAGFASMTSPAASGAFPGVLGTLVSNAQLAVQKIVAIRVALFKGCAEILRARTMVK